MSVLANITEGWSGAIGPFILKVNGVVFNFTGMTPKLYMRDAQGNQFAAGGTTFPGDAAQGQVFYQPTPTGSEFVANGSQPRTYNVRVAITDSVPVTIFFPNGQPDQIVVWPK